MEYPIRITAVRNGDYSTVGKIFIIKDVNLNGVFATVSKWFTGEEEQKVQFSRVFTASGAEITELDEIIHNDMLFFSDGADFISKDQAAQAPSSSLAAALSVEKHRFLEQVAAKAVEHASFYYEKTSGFAKERSPAIIKSTIETVEQKVSEIAQQQQTKDIVTKAQAIVTPYMNWADDTIDLAVAKTVQASIGINEMTVAAGKQLNDSVLLPLKSSVMPPTEAFFRMCANTFSLLDKSGKGLSEVNVNEFIEKLQTVVGSQWNEKLKQPAMQFFETISSEYKDVLAASAPGQSQLSSILTDVKQKLESAKWETNVITNFSDKMVILVEVCYEQLQERLVTPATIFYTQALHIFTGLQKSGDGSVSYSEFIVGIRAHLGAFWNDKLAPRARQLYELFLTLHFRGDAPEGDAEREKAGQSIMASLVEDQ